MKEIGGYLEFEELINQEYYPGLKALNTGRNALLYILKARNIQKIYLPYYLCHSVSNMCSYEGYEYEFYRIHEDFTPDFQKKLNEREYLYVVNFFGQLSDQQLMDLKQQHGNIIVDNTHSFFQKPLPGIDTLYSIRKYFGVPDGAYLSTEIDLGEELEQDFSRKRVKHLLGRYEELASEHYTEFKEADEVLERVPLKKMSKFTHNILGAIDYENVRKKRNENFRFLAKQLDEENKLNIIFQDGSFVYPFYVSNGIEARKMLAKKKIYVPTYWPDVIKNTKLDWTEYNYTLNILPLPCDQRYDLEDMAKVVEEVQKHLKTTKIRSF